MLFYGLYRYCMHTPALLLKIWINDKGVLHFAFFLNDVHACARACVYMRLSAGQSPGAGVTGCCALSDMGAGSWTLVFGEYMFLTTKPPLQFPHFTLYACVIDINHICCTLHIIFSTSGSQILNWKVKKPLGGAWRDGSGVKSMHCLS